MDRGSRDRSVLFIRAAKDTGAESVTVATSWVFSSGEKANRRVLQSNVGSVAGKLFKTGSDVPEAWGYAAQFSFGSGAKLSPEASQWVKSAELRMQPIFGGAGGTAKELDPSSRAAGALLFTTIANELEAK